MWVMTRLETCPTLFHRFSRVARDMNDSSEKPGGARGPRARSYLEDLSSKLRTRAACAPRSFHRFSRVAHCDMNDSSENVGQDAILSHVFSSFPGEFCELVNDSSEIGSAHV